MPATVTQSHIGQVIQSERQRRLMNTQRMQTELLKIKCIALIHWFVGYLNERVYDQYDLLMKDKYEYSYVYFFEEKTNGFESGFFSQETLFLAGKLQRAITSLHPRPGRPSDSK